MMEPSTPLDPTAPFNLNALDVASPCSADWEAMTGDERKRHCAMCNKNVFNLSEMTHHEAVSFIQETEGPVCVRFYRRTDGTVLTADCPVGLAETRRRQVRTRISKHLKTAAAVTLITVAGSFWLNPASAGDTSETPPTKPCTKPAPQVLMGDVAYPEQPTQKPASKTHDTPRSPGPEVMGEMVLPPERQTPPQKPQKQSATPHKSVQDPAIMGNMVIPQPQKNPKSSSKQGEKPPVILMGKTLPSTQPHSQTPSKNKSDIQRPEEHMLMGMVDPSKVKPQKTAPKEQEQKPPRHIMGRIKAPAPQQTPTPPTTIKGSDKKSAVPAPHPEMKEPRVLLGQLLRETDPVDSSSPSGQGS